ncbi:alpha-L-fucosidase [Fulvivirgaceae bacterium BMA10]|uniref:alpha-L-fucosidase n=1 Tax=Splendidivirga corallicola TaxID=3051826 RepID=A0ABT8KN85_9BACT|nr:alpha-L-fucosidase [Fulvivirgaceae bacterium BMA10]
MKPIYNLLIAVLVFACQQKQPPSESTAEQINYLEESEEAFDQRMAWWRDAKFGMFIHWGVYAVPAGIHDGKETDFIAEWIMNSERIPIARYEEYARQFDPQEFDADSWMKLASEAGVKYIVITSKHHDGFALWDSKVSDYDIMDFAPYKKDILKSLSEACKKYNIKFGLYHSIMDWHHPQAQSINEPHYWAFGGENKSNPEFPNYLEGYMKPQLKELIENYDPAILWFDGEWVDDFTHEQGQALYQYIRELKPDILINNRVDKGRQGMQGMNAEGDFAGDFGTPEQEILATSSDLDWESCMTMNDTWGYDQTDENWKSTAQLVHNLVDVAAKGGNYLLNIGPTGEGLIPDASVERLQQIGKWLKINGEAIYNTQKLEKNYLQADSVRYIRKKGTDTFYVVKMGNLPGSVTFSHVKPAETADIKLLGYDKPLQWKFDKDRGVTIDIPKNIDLSYWENTRAWTFKIEHAEEVK